MPRLPIRLPERLKVVWSRPLNSRGLAGIAATKKYVIVADREATDRGDLIRCLDAAAGKEVWQVAYSTFGSIKDYGNVPRATPLIHGDKVYTIGGLGDLRCIELGSGKVVWSKNLPRDFGTRVPTWGYSASPLAVDGKLIINPGAKQAAVVALDCSTGKEVWRCAGLPPAYASFIAGTFGGVRQVIGYDEKSLGGWDLVSGKRIWTLIPPSQGDFNVPTPIDAGGKLIVATENNGARLYEFEAGGRMKTSPAAACGDLSPDSSTPVLLGGRLFGSCDALYCLDVAAKFKPLWTGADDAFSGYASLIAAPGRVLVTTNHGELLLVSASAERFEIVSRLRVFPKESEVLSHPAIVAGRIYLRDMEKIQCVDLDSP